MSSSHKSLVTQIKADEKILLANRRAMDKVQLQFQCKCAHRDGNGGFALSVPSGQNPRKSQFNGAPLYRCQVCGKELDISNISEEEFNRAFDIVNRVIDLSKMHLDLNSEKDLDTLKTLSKMQYRMNAMLPDAHKTIRKGGRKKKNNNNPMSGMIEVGR